jgi:nucleoside-diphosphate-sugar epimerase
VTVRDVGTAVATLSGGDPGLLRWGARAYRADESMWIVGDNARFRAATGWAPRFDLWSGLTDTIRRRSSAAA